MDKSPDAFRTISEAAEQLDLPQHVLRFWETRFSTIKPLKRGGGRRYYRPEDVMLLKGIRHLLYDQGFTIKGVQRILKEQGIRQVIAIGEGRIPDPAAITGPPDHAADDEGETGTRDLSAELDPSPDENTTSRREPSPPNPVLEPRDREKLSEVLRDLLDCKRLLERAREG